MCNNSPRSKSQKSGLIPTEHPAWRHNSLLCFHFCSHLLHSQLTHREQNASSAWSNYNNVFQSTTIVNIRMPFCEELWYHCRPWNWFFRLCQCRLLDVRSLCLRFRNRNLLLWFMRHGPQVLFTISTMYSFALYPIHGIGLRVSLRTR